MKACAACNVGASKDDEYFRDLIVKHHKVADLPQAQAQLASMFRAAANPKKYGHTAATLASFIEVDVTGPAGAVSGTAPAIRVDEPRLQRAVERYMLGLYRYELGRRPAPACEVRALVNPNTLDEHADEVVGLFTEERKRVVQEGVFWYAWNTPYDKPEASVWLLVFFDAVPFMGVVGPERGVAV